MLVGAFLGALWLTPLGFGQNVAWRTSWPLWTAALVTVLEAALIIGTPLGIALSDVCRCRSRRESADGPVRSSELRETLFTLGGLLVVGGLLGAAANRYWGAPGNVVRGVVAGALVDCREKSGGKSATVPLIGAHWVCPMSQPANLVGELSRGKTVLRYTTTNLVISEDLSTVDLSDLELSVPRASHRGGIHLAVERARLRGAWPWARQTRIPGPGRAFYVSLVASILGAFVWSIARRRCGALGIGHVVSSALGAASGWLLLRWVDAHASHASWTIGAYAAVPLAAMAVAMSLERICGSNWLRLAPLFSGWLLFRAWCRRLRQSVL